MPRTLFLLQELVRRDFQSRYAGSLLGLLWSFVQPLWQLLLFGFVFGSVMRVPLTEEGTGSFALFLMCGLLPWLAVQEGIARSATAITDNASLVAKVSFPSELLPLSAVLTALLHQGIAMLLLVGVLAGLGELEVAGLPWLLVALPLQLAVTSGLALLAAAVHVFFRDTVQLLGMLLQAWFYLTPIVYPQALVPASLAPVLARNPLATLVGLYRQALLGSSAVGGDRLAWLAVFAVAAATLGWTLFARLRPTFADEV